MLHRFSIPILLIFGVNFAAPAQELLEINLANRCIFHTTVPEEELYSFRTNVEVMPNLVADILAAGGDLEQNFTLIQANVENVSAVLDGERRVLLWSQDFLEKSTRLMAYASIAHEIGHHVNLHRFAADRSEIEEREADAFMGFVLGMRNIPIGNVIVSLKTEGVFSSSSNRPEAIAEGFKKADKSLRITSVAWDDDRSWENFQKAAFPFPPPDCYQNVELSRNAFYDCQTLGDLGKKISREFDKKYYPYRFLSVPGGFAVVTQIEQYQADGSIFWDSRTRWTELPVGESFSFSLNYFKKMLYPQKAFLRILVVLVTKANFNSGQKLISKEAAKSWVSQGVNRLPKGVAAIPFDPDFAVDFLVYEFEVPETNHQPRQNCPCQLDARKHLEKIGLDFWLR